MPSLESLVPEIAAYQQAQNQGQQQQLGMLQQAGVLQGIMSKQRDYQEMQQIKGMLVKVAQETGGDPAKMAPILMQSGHPKLMEIATRMMPKPASFTSAGNGILN